ncbi:U32 family peptidase [bacterium]|nr:U32 family peptidase [bacterium]
MKFVLHLSEIDYLESVIKINITDVVLQTSRFSVTGRISDNDLFDVLEKLNFCGKKVILLWDILCHDDDILHLADILIQHAKQISSIRFADPGVGAYLKNRFPDHGLQFLMWDGHQNCSGVLEWINAFEPSLNRIILSNQIPVQTIRKLRQDTAIPIEIKGLGRMQVFYSARRLLGNQYPQSMDTPRQVVAASTDRPSQFFPVVENRHGTAIFNDRDLCLLDELETIQTAGVDYFGLDFDSMNQFKILENGLDPKEWVDPVKSSWNRPITKGFFFNNRTDALLDKLTNAFLRDDKQHQIGLVIESSKNGHTLFHLQQNLVLPQRVLFLTPERKKIPFEIVKLHDLKGKVYMQTAHEGYYLLPWIKYVGPASVMNIIASGPQEDYLIPQRNLEKE